MAKSHAPKKINPAQQQSQRPGLEKEMNPKPRATDNMRNSLGTVSVKVGPGIGATLRVSNNIRVPCGVYSSRSA